MVKIELTQGQSGMLGRKVDALPETAFGISCWAFKLEDQTYVVPENWARVVEDGL